MPADVVEKNIRELIAQDLQALKGDRKLRQHVEEEVQRLCGSQLDAKKGLVSRLIDIDSQISKLTTHLFILDVQTATTLRLYAKAKTLSEERQMVQAELKTVSGRVGSADISELSEKMDQALDQFEQLFESGLLEEKREFVRTYVKRMSVDPPKVQEIEVTFLPASQVGLGEEFSTCSTETVKIFEKHGVSSPLARAARRPGGCSWHRRCVLPSPSPIRR